MLYLIKTIANLILPPGCLIIALFIYIVLYYKKNKKLPKLIVAILIPFYIISIPLTSNLLMHSLEYKYQQPSKVNGDVIIVLGGGATLTSPDLSGNGNLYNSAGNRLLTAARIHMKTGLPILFTGGQVFKTSGNEAEIAKRQLLDLGLNKNSIIMENKSLNTTQNAKFTSVLLKKYNYTKPILLTSAFHMPRAVVNFNNSEIKNLQIYPTDYTTNKTLSINFNSFVPSYSSLSYSCEAFHEYLGIIQLIIKK
ncbi:YdcF family protein [Clostridium psychrophilum]|uniref:YdcF family protein n=1 Tax=Clostridium psychrophilum TaxID=132926 RepID=UPI001C0AEAD8|nr:YdcF family protein [Clostridium psychrophilum]MBU3181011.1 YdcF family protein [Clostridium psychrophilum]